MGGSCKKVLARPDRAHINPLQHREPRHTIHIYWSHCYNIVQLIQFHATFTPSCSLAQRIVTMLQRSSSLLLNSSYLAAVSTRAASTHSWFGHVEEAPKVRNC